MAECPLTEEGESWLLKISNLKIAPLTVLSPVEPLVKESYGADWPKRRPVAALEGRWCGFYVCIFFLSEGRSTKHKGSKSI
jgi:hypothetical protein